MVRGGGVEVKVLAAGEEAAFEGLRGMAAW